MTQFLYYQHTGESEWKQCVADSVDRVIEDEKPQFTTVLSIDTVIQDDFTNEDYEKIRYKGPFYADFDGETLEQVIPRFQRFLSKIQEKGVTLDQLEIAITGGRGFHVLIDQRIFQKNPASNGYTFLPQIYKEMAYQVYTDSMDMRVYSAKKGRMWRTYNVERPNGKFKVQITADEALEITAETYLELCSAPRPRFKPAKSVYTPDMALLFAQAKSKVEAGLAKRAKKRSGANIIKRYGGVRPATIDELMSGKGWKADAGFQEISLQLAIVAHSFGIEEKEFLNLCEGLCNDHQSDGRRYNTPEKRRKELSRMYAYMDGNPCYEYSVGALKSKIDDAVLPAQDLDPPDVVPTEDEQELEDLDPLHDGVIVRKSGFYLKRVDKETGEVEFPLKSDFGVSDVRVILDDQGNTEAFDVLVHPHMGQPFRTKVDLNDFETRVLLRRAFKSAGVLQYTDNQASVVQNIFTKMAQKSGKVMQAIRTEGLNVIPLKKEAEHPWGPTAYQIWWIDGKECFCEHLNGEKVKAEFRYSPVKGEASDVRSDLPAAPPLEDTEETRRFFDEFFKAFPRATTAKVFGWYIAAFTAPAIRRTLSRFPLLQSYGEAGGGKTSFNRLCLSMHTYRKKLPVLAAGNLTTFALQLPMINNASIPVVLDEFKVSEIRSNYLKDFLGIMRSSSEGGSTGKGTVNRGRGSSSLGVDEAPLVAPLAFMSEQKIDQEAILHRSVMVDFPAAHTVNAEVNFSWLDSKSEYMGQLGKVIMTQVMVSRVESMAEQLLKINEELEASLPPDTAKRSAFALATVVFGLYLGRSAFKKVFGDRYEDIFEELIMSIRRNAASHTHKVMSEATRVLDAIALLSTREAGDPLRLEYDVDWNYSTGPNGQECVDLNLRNCWNKYTQLAAQQRFTPLFPSEFSYLDAMTRHGSVVDRVCADNLALKKGRVTTKVYRFDLQRLLGEGVEEFAAVVK